MVDSEYNQRALSFMSKSETRKITGLQRNGTSRCHMRALTYKTNRSNNIISESSAPKQNCFALDIPGDLSSFNHDNIAIPGHDNMICHTRNVALSAVAVSTLTSSFRIRSTKIRMINITYQNAYVYDWYIRDARHIIKKQPKNSAPLLHFY